MQKVRRKVWIGAGMSAIVAVSLAATLGLSNADTVVAQQPLASSQGLTDQQQDAALRVVKLAGDATAEALRVGDNIVDGCEDVDTPQAKAATAQGLKTMQSGSTAMQALRQARSLIRSGQMTQDMTQLVNAVSAARAAMADARTTLSLAQTAVAANPNARRSSVRMLNGAVNDINSGAEDMTSAQSFLDRAFNGG